MSSNIIDCAYDLLRPRSPEGEALAWLLGKAAFRVATDLGLTDPTGAGCDAVEAVQTEVARRVISGQICAACECWFETPGFGSWAYPDGCATHGVAVTDEARKLLLGV